VPVYKLLGGRRAKSTRVYAGDGETTRTRRECVKAKEAGFTAVGKLSPFGDVARMCLTLKHMRSDRRRRDTIRQIREAVGNDLDLLIDCTASSSPANDRLFNKVPNTIRCSSKTRLFRTALTTWRCGQTLHCADGDGRAPTYDSGIHDALQQAGGCVRRADIGLCGGFTGARKLRPSRKRTAACSCPIRLAVPCDGGHAPVRRCRGKHRDSGIPEP
jgi:hypothetical protein